MFSGVELPAAAYKKVMLFTIKWNRIRK